MLVHAHRHLPCTQRPHTRCYSPNTRSLTHTPCLTHTHHTTHTRGGTHPRCFTHTPCLTHACRFRLRCPFNTRRAGKHVPRLTRDHTTHTQSAYSSILGVSFKHGVALTLVTTHTGTLTPGTLTPGIRVSTRAPGASIPPKLRVHPSAALFPSTSQSPTGPTWSRPASRGHSVSLRSRRRLSRCPHRVSTRSASSPPLSSTTCVCVFVFNPVFTV